MRSLLGRLRLTNLDAALKYCILSALFLAICAAFAYAPSRMLAGPVDFTAPVGSNNATITLATEIISADPISRTFIMDWRAILADPCDTSSPLVANIYLDPAFLDQSSPSFSSIPPYLPAFQYSDRAESYLGTQYIALFRTVLTLSGLPFQCSTSSNIRQYPFDEYVAQVVLYAVNNETGAYIPLNITRSFGSAVNFDVSLWDTSMNQYDSGLQTLWIALKIKRSRTTKLFVMLIAVINWLIALAFTLICAATMIYPQHEIYSEMFVVPVGALFSLTSVRANLPGAPSGFGAAIDTYTILPVVVILGACSVFLLLIVLWRRVRVGRASAENEEPKVQRIIVNLSGEEDHLVIFGNKPSVMVRLCQSHSSAETSV